MIWWLILEHKFQKNLSMKRFNKRQTARRALGSLACERSQSNQKYYLRVYSQVFRRILDQRKLFQCSADTQKLI